MADLALDYRDLIIILVYFVLCLGVGLWSSCRANTGSVKGYFLAGRDMMWIPVGASVFATNVGSQFFIGMAGSAAASGLAVVIYEWHAVFILVLLGWIFIPVYVNSGSYTMPMYLKKRYGGRRLRVYLSCLAIFLLIVQTISVSMYAGAVFIQQSVGWNLYLSVACVTIITAVYTIIGGLTAVIWTDTLQTFIMVFGSLWLCVAALGRVGGMSGLFTKFMQASPNITTCGNVTGFGHPRADSLHIFRHPIRGDIPWPGIIFGLTPMAILAWCTDQVVVQRVLAAKTHSHAKGGVILAAWLKLLPFFLIIVPGMAGRVLFPNEVACVNPDECERVCGDPNGCSNIVYPKLVVEILPPGLRGLLLAVNLSALMSTLTSVFNGASSMFTLDLYLRVRSHASERELMVVGRAFIVVLVGISLAWVPILMAAQGGRLWDYLQAMQAYLAPPFVVVFIMGIAWPRTTEQGAFWSLMAGLVVGGTRLIMDLAYRKPTCGEEDPRPSVLSKVDFLYFAFLVFSVSLFVLVVVSLLTKKRPSRKLRRCTWATRHSPLSREDSTDDENFEDETLRQAHMAVEDSDAPLTCRQRLYSIMCCYSSFKPQPKTKAMLEEEVRRYRGEGEPWWVPMLLDAQALLVVAFTTFAIAFFA